MPSREPNLTLPLWPAGAPAAFSDAAADKPWMEVFHPENPNGAAVLISPGGGYGHHAEHEGRPVALWLNTLGITGIVVRYRLKPYKHPQPLNDLSQAMRLAKTHATDWQIDPARIGVLGFSAGGHLSATLSTHFDADTRPAFSILLYPVITFGPFGHAGSRETLLTDPNDPLMIEDLSLENRVTAQTPPTFMFHTMDDEPVPVESVLLYAAALRKHGVPFELHVYETGPHGVGLATKHAKLASWPSLCASWLVGR